MRSSRRGLAAAQRLPRNRASAEVRPQSAARRGGFFRWEAFSPPRHHITTERLTTAQAERATAALIATVAGRREVDDVSELACAAAAAAADALRLGWTCKRPPVAELVKYETARRTLAHDLGLTPRYCSRRTADSRMEKCSACAGRILT